MFAMSITTKYLLFLLHCLIVISLMLERCTSLEIIQSPTSQIIALGESSTFYCSGSGHAFQMNIHLNDDIEIVTEPHSEPRPGIQVDIVESVGMIYTATVIIEGSESTNNTKLDCTVSDFSLVKRSNTATLIVIGPPSAITFIEFNIDVQSNEFLAIWSVPYSHMNYAITSYNVSVSNINTTEVYQRTITVSSQDMMMSSVMNDTLDFPSLTNECDIINVTVIVINDIGNSPPTSANLYVPTVPETDISVNTVVYFYSNGTPVIMIDIKFPVLCWFETLNYSLVLHNDNVTVVMEKSLLNPPELITEKLTDVMPNTHYSLVVKASTTVWNASTTPYNFSTELSACVTTATSGVSPCDENNLSPTVLGVTIGIGALLIIVIILGIILLLVYIIFQPKKTKDVRTARSVDNLQVESMRCDLMPNPIYDGPVYDAIIEPTFRPQQPSTVANRRSVYCESPTRRQDADCKGLPTLGGHKEMEECYIQMKTCNKQ